jgi:hypothetical protein
MTVPNEITAGELASILGVSERRVAALKAEGRIPTAGNGKVLLHELLTQQHAELAKIRQQPHLVKRMASSMTWDERHPADAMARVALRCLTMAMPAQVAKAAAAIGINGPMLEALSVAMRRQAIVAEDEAREMCGLLQDPDGPEPVAEVPVHAA